jgi:hypothetical protein
VVGSAGVDVGAAGVVFSGVLNYMFMIASLPVFVAVVAGVLPTVLVAAAAVVGAGVVDVLVVLVMAGVCNTTRDVVACAGFVRRRSRSY